MASLRAAATDEVPPTTGVAASADLNRADALRRIRNLSPEAQEMLKRHWPAQGKKLPELDEMELDILLVRIDQLESEFSAPFMNSVEPVLEPINDAKPVRKPAKKKAVKK